MDDTTPALPAARRTNARDRVVRLGRSLAGNALRGAATGAGTTLGTWTIWWLINH